MKAISLCLVAFASISTAFAAGTKYHLNPDKVYGKGREYEQSVLDKHNSEERKERGFGDVQSLNMTQKVDHFNNADNRTFNMRYLIENGQYNNTYGPILFYAGNEGSILTFYDNTGFQTDYLAKKFAATVVFAEHRFYGTSMPFGNDSFDKTSGNLRYLNVQQVMEDYVALLVKLKQDDPTLKDRATILFGGSYGGMLAAWMRMKYPHMFQGALASSAPVLWFRGQVDSNAYTIVASKVIKQQGGQECYESYSRGFYDLANLKYDASKYGNIKSIFNLCDDLSKPEDVQDLIDLVSDSLGTMAMVNYPYETNFINKLPAWPQKYACDKVKNTTSSLYDQLMDVSQYNFTNIEALQRGADVFYNYEGTMQCLNLSESNSGGLDDNGWAVQSCNDMPMPQGDDPSQSCFTWVNFDEAAFNDSCKELTNMTPRWDWALDYFGGRNVRLDWSKTSNIIFSNGELDPWHAGGVLEDVMPDNHVIWIKQSAHHLDLRLPNEADPLFVKNARKQEEKIIKKWIEDYQNQVLPDNTA